MIGTVKGGSITLGSLLGATFLVDFIIALKISKQMHISLRMKIIQANGVSGSVGMG